MWPLIKLLPTRTNFHFVRYSLFAAILSTIGVVGSLFLILAPMVQGQGIGLNLGIDFKGGILIDLASDQPVPLDALRQRIGGLNVGDYQLQNYEGGKEVQLRFESPDTGRPDKQVELVQNAVRDLIPDVRFERVEVVGPQVSGELLWTGIISLAGAIGLILIYVWFRFEWQLGLGGVIALAHDVIMTMGLFSLLHLEFTLTVVAALLTIVGYSINDTVVTLDRLRENLRKFKKMPLRDVIDLSVNETLSRTIMTGSTTLIAVLGMLFFGGDTLFGFTFAITFGVISGTFSSVYVAVPMVLVWGLNRGAPKTEELEAAAG